MSVKLFPNIEKKDQSSGHFEVGKNFPPPAKIVLKLLNHLPLTKVKQNDGCSKRVFCSNTEKDSVQESCSGKRKGRFNLTSCILGLMFSADTPSYDSSGE